MASLTRIAFDRKGLWTMLGSFSVGAGVGVHSLWNPAFYLGFGLRSVGLVRAVGVFLVIVSGWYVVRTLWMFADRLWAIEFGEDSLVVRAAGPPVRQIAWLDVQGATASKHHVSIRRTTGNESASRRLSWSFLMAGAANGWLWKSRSVGQPCWSRGRPPLIVGARAAIFPAYVSKLRLWPIRGSQESATAPPLR